MEKSFMLMEYSFDITYKAVNNIAPNVRLIHLYRIT